jgi:hypothetical protein
MVKNKKIIALVFKIDELLFKKLLRFFFLLFYILVTQINGRFNL